MIPKIFLGKRAQVSLEVLILASVVIIMSMSVFAFYTQIRESTNAMGLLKVEALKKIDEMGEKITVKEIDYKIEAGNNIVMCIYTKPETAVLWDAAGLTDLQNFIETRTGFSSVLVEQNIAGACD